MRRRKPCVLARRRLFGWYVRLLTRVPSVVRVLACRPATVGSTVIHCALHSGSNRSAGTARPRSSPLRSDDPVDMRRRSTLVPTTGDRPTVRGAGQQGQTTADRPDRPLGRPARDDRHGLWTTGCPERSAGVTFVGYRGSLPSPWTLGRFRGGSSRSSS